jgi:hypothetical protein
MHPYISQAIVHERAADLQRRAAASRLARQARLAGRQATPRHAARLRPAPSGAGRPRAA